ncbi:MAG: DUF3029 family protein, partial [Thermaerobacter sp.]|nr:DUF3029 family protein [Thermaerobacter sp.]
YLVKKSEMEALARGKQVRNSAVTLGKGAAENQGVLHRKLRAQEE